MIASCPVCRSPQRKRLLRADELHLGDRQWQQWVIARCSSCGLVYVTGRGAEPARALYEGEEYGFLRSALADAYVDGRPHAQRVLEELEAIGPHGRLLDIGCATGEFLLAARQRGWTVEGVEVSAYASAVARRRGLTVETGTLEEAAFADGSFDVVTLLDVIEHVEDPVSLLLEIRRILKPNGIVCFETPNWNSVYRRILRKRWAALQPRLHILYFERRSAEALLHAAAFEPLKSTTEIVALFTSEGRKRGFGFSSVRAALRDIVVRQLIARDVRRFDRYLLAIGPAARSPAPRSFKMQAESGEASHVVLGARHWVRFIRALNAPIDRLLLRLDMGEQLRVYGRRA